jgi:formamidopyrimidine-DNA glycosylase
MPELPEVETITRQLNQVLKGKVIKEIEVLKEKSFKGDKKKILGKKIKRVRRRAKMIIIEFDKSKDSLAIHLKMTGRLVYAENFQDKYTRVVIKFDKGALLFSDLRVFGWIKVMGKRELEKEMSKFGVDVIDKEFTIGYLKKALEGSRRAIKLVLLDQKKMAGIGNIYACEILFCAGVNPKFEAQNLKQIQINELYKCIKRVINKAIKYGGTTAGDEMYVNARGEAGKYQKHRLVYDRVGLACLRCKTKIKKIKLGGRGTYFCPRCQE